MPLPSRGERTCSRRASPADRGALDAIHAWFACCDGGAITESEARDSRALVAIAGSGSS